ncbi:MAG: dihydropteroate synthase [Candidatus Omnitrophica bacterium]|nr:dihydropteroate synthase [Candidatus Omnitrophota bacterium]MDD5771071.1 dihydropteroate synthase [Candidatus Omnitrophota bacterium]
MRILNSCYGIEAKSIMHDIGVDPYGIDIMLPKTSSYLIRTGKLPNAAANILKQEMLSLGGDAAVSRGSLTGRAKKSSCLIIGRENQLDSLIRKLRSQPFGLSRFADELQDNLANYKKRDFTVSLGKKTLDFKNKVYVMGVINLTPDSFSGDGLSAIKTGDCTGLALKRAKQMIKDGADIIDLGGESSRPGTKGISVKEELRRLLPVVRKMAKNISTPISVDTVNTEVAKACLDCGARMINDISGLRDRRMAKTAARHKAAVVIMHMRGNPLNMQKKTAYRSLIEDISLWLKNAVACAEDLGVSPDKIIVDPGIGFGKTVEQNLEIIKRISDFRILGKPILVGPSRKSFIGKVLNAGPKERITGTLTSCVMAAERGANVVRVHDVKEVSEALKMSAAIIRGDANA